MVWCSQYIHPPVANALPSATCVSTGVSQSSELSNGHRCSNPHCVVEFGSDQEHCLFDKECSLEGTQLFQVHQEEVPALFCVFETGAFDHTAKRFILDQLSEAISDKYWDY